MASLPPGSDRRLRGPNLTRLGRAWLERRRHLDQLGQGARAHFCHNLAAVRFHRDLADAEFITTCLFDRPETTNAMTSRSRG
jgi:hypothetical protein